MAVYPFNYLNKRGIPAVQTRRVTVNTDNVTFSFADHAFAGIPFTGLVLIYIAQEVPAGATATLPIVFQTNGAAQEVTGYNGAAVTVADLAGTGVYLAFYDRATGLLQLMTGIV
jgi:hypothetical protein